MQHKSGIFFFLTFALFILLSANVSAQMFSIETNEDNNRNRPLMFHTTAGLGFSFASFDFHGPPANASELHFKGNILKLFLDTPGLEFSTSFGGSFTGLGESSYFNIGARIHNSFSFIRKEDLLLAIPIQLTTDLTQASSSAPSASHTFRQNTLMFGTGLNGIIRFSERVAFTFKTTPNYGFSFSQGSLFGGSVFRVDGKAMLAIGRVFGNRGLSLGYDYDYKFYDIDLDQDDYKFNAHTITLGITF